VALALKLPTVDASTRRKMIREVPEAGPDSLNAILEEISGLNAENCGPP
jgi:hypothetical protein